MTDVGVGAAQDTVVSVVALLRQLARKLRPDQRRDLLARVVNGGIDSPSPVSLEQGEQLLRSAIDLIPDARYRQAATALLLAEPLSSNLTERQWLASSALGVAPDSFRRRYRDGVLESVAEQLLHERRRATSTATGAEVDGGGRHSAAQLFATILTGSDEAVLLIGNLLVVKTRGHVSAKTLNTTDLTALRNDRVRLLNDPPSAMEFLLRPDTENFSTDAS